MNGFAFNEKYLSQIPALQLLVNLGFAYITPEEALRLRGGKPNLVLLEGILRNRLKKNNRIQHKGQTYLFSEENIQSAVQRLKNIKYDGLLKTNEAVYDLLTLGVSLEQNVEGDNRSFSMNYVDWKNPANNDFHVTAEFSVERSRSTETVRPDIVLFVNGIPFAVIECKAPHVEVSEAVSQTIRNQRDEYIPRLFSFVQMVVAVSKNEAKYATTGTPAKFWAVWRERDDHPDHVAAAVNKTLSEADKDALFSGDFCKAREAFDALEAGGERQVTEQDNSLHSLCRPERLLDLAWRFTVFDGGIRKIARYQQFFAVLRLLERVKKYDGGRRRGGIVWHTQGSGKSLTMVMLARALALDPSIRNPRIVLVTDRVDLDKQLGNTFAACGLSPERADSARHLLALVAKNQTHIITTLIHKFARAFSIQKHVVESSDVFVLVDESHRTNFGGFAARMRQMFPQACYIGFTGTPLMKSEKNSFVKFGGMVDTYSIDQAVKDKAVVPLLYEARLVEIEQNKQAIDTWFERHTKGLTDAQRADLKKKYSHAETLNKADQVIYMRAFDISEHYRESWQNTGFKAQLVAPSKAAALKYKECLDEIGHVSSEVVISAPDTREGNEEVDAGPEEVVAFWEKMMKRYGSEEEYNKQIVNQFKYGEDVEILIVVDKLLTGFDAPRNTVLYLTRALKEHTLLQAIARVNRLYDDEDGRKPKEFGFIVDYAGVLGELDRALTSYRALEGYEEQDLQNALHGINEEIGKLPQQHADLLDIFKELKNKHDEEACEQLLADEQLRNDFYERLTAYAKTLAIAMSSEQFVTTTPEKKVQGYKSDLKRFTNLRASVKMRYAESIDYRDFEPKIKKLLDTHITASEVIRLNEPVNIFDDNAFKQIVEDSGDSKSTAAKADMIAHSTKKAISERLEQDPAFYEKFSKLIQKAIDDFRSKRLSDLEYLTKASEIRSAVVNRRFDELPKPLQGNEDAVALFGVLEPFITVHSDGNSATNDLAAQAAVDIWSIIERNRKVGYWEDLDAQRRTMNDIDDYLYDEIKDNQGLALTTVEMDGIIERAMQVARHRMVS
jgi:type I restriction enzyme R subunit